MTIEWVTYRCPSCGRTVGLDGPDQEARCGQCQKPLIPTGPLPADFYNGSRP